MTIGRRAMRPGLRRLALGMLALTLTGCGNAPDENTGWAAFSGAFSQQLEKRKAGDDPASAAATQARAAQGALSNNTGPLLFAVMDNTKNMAILGELERNGPYRTFRTASMQTMIFRDGILTGTRGLGYDLLSSDATQSAALIRAKRTGQSQRIYRHLTGDNHEAPMTLTCAIEPQGSDKVVLATGRSLPATKVKETCRNEDRKVTNRYWVTGSGQIVQSIQWISPEMGKVAVQVLRD